MARDREQLFHHSSNRKKSRIEKMHNPEYQYEVALFGIRALSNLHVGSGSENYGIIDNLVQRDAATGFPCIHASSLKGALREYCRNYAKGAVDVDVIFGKDKKGTDRDKDGNAPGEEQFVQGKYRFLQADLLSIPLRGYERPYYNAACPWLLTNLGTQLRLFRKALPKDWISPLVKALNRDGVHFEAGNMNVDLDEIALSPGGTLPQHLDEAKTCIGEAIAVLQDEHFVELVSDYRLPVIARNNLEDGRSSNLWYEQVLPRETRLAFFVLYPKGEANQKEFDAFKKAITGYPVQIGANASVGYGFCELTEIPLNSGN